MKLFFDTSVLVAAVLVQHTHHEPSLTVYQRTEKKHAYCAAHSLAEVYASLTRLPGRQRLSSEQALLLIDNIAERLTTISLESSDYRSAIADAAAQGIVGGTIYDALLACCALKAKADIIYTWDVRHFGLLGQEIAKRVRTP